MKRPERRRYAADEVAGFDKRVLAQLYYPENSPRIAVRRLKQAIRRCPELAAELTAHGYRPRLRRFTPAEVGLLYEYLGEP